MKRFLAVIAVCILCSYLMVSEANCFVKLPEGFVVYSSETPIILINVDLIKQIELSHEKLVLYSPASSIVYKKDKLSDATWAKRVDMVLITLRSCMKLPITKEIKGN